MTNDRIANVFDEIADLLEFQGANPFRIRAYRTGARVVRDLTEPITAIIQDPSRQLTAIQGIGKDLASKVETLLETGELPQRTELLEKIPSSVLGLLRVPGLGPKKAAVLFQQLEIRDLDSLKQACEDGRVRGLKGFGVKTEEVILRGISIAVAANERVYWSRADTIAQSLREHLGASPEVERLEVAGSYRRGKELVGDLDILVVSRDAAGVMDRFGAFSDVASVTARGESKMSVRLHSGFQVDLRVMLARSFGAALQYFTGSKDHNVVLRGRARQRGLKINEYGVFRGHEGEEQLVAGRTEEDVYAALDLPWFPPELREARREFDWAAQGPLPELIEVADLRGDLHMHTTATDGKASIEEMVQTARQRGLQYIAITEHSQRVSMASGLDPQRVMEQWAEIDRLNDRLQGDFVVLKGIECDILEKGGLDLPDEVLAQADWVLAAIHYGQKQSRRQITDRLVEALQNPYVHAIAHPTGRLLNQREAYDVDMDAVFQAARQHGKMLELNANPARLDLNDVYCATAKSLGIPVVINTDAHHTAGLDCMRFGVLQARRAGLTKEAVANTQSREQLQKMLRPRA